jgi:diguanylate cyclase (GGDEF)-like protein
MSDIQQNATQILLVEDDDADAVLFERALSTCAGAYRLQVCSTLAEAVVWLDDHCCDVILLDLSLPDSFGLDGIREIHKLHADLPIVMLTGLDDDKTALDALDSGAQDYLVKGAAKSRELERTLRHAIQRQQIQNENRRLVKELKHAARSDALTGVLNRHAMITEFERHWSSSQSTGVPLSCVILDVDHFKSINDRFGHLAGDEVLQAVAQLISDSTRPGDCIARYGGEEFCVILVECMEQDAVKWADRARHQLANSPFQLADQGITVTASFGAAQRTTETNTIEELIDAADQALMVAKNSGRNRVIASSTSGSSVSQVKAPVLTITGELTTEQPTTRH